MKYLIILLCFSLSGCFYQTVDISDINTAQSICKENNSEIFSISASCFGEERVTCNNRNTYIISAK